MGDEPSSGLGHRRSSEEPSRAIPPRTKLALRATRAVNRLSRALGAGGGTVAGGRVGLAIDPLALARLGHLYPSALVSGTNGKTTTNRLLCAALDGAGIDVVTNTTGSNMPAGHLGALAGAHAGSTAVLEVDEGYVPAAMAALAPRVVTLLNLSRDQLDRNTEVRMVARRWRDALEGTDTLTVANADDPLVVFAAAGSDAVAWVPGGSLWRADSVGCPECTGAIRFDHDGGWSCDCGFKRPELHVLVEHEGSQSFATFGHGPRLEVALSLPGAFNRRNAVMAACAAEAFGVDPAASLAAMTDVESVAGRFSVATIGGVKTRLLLAKNPAGWLELLDVVARSGSPVVVAINARVADGRDPSWLWDVPFELLAGRCVVAAGERSADLSVRLHYGDVAHDRVPDAEKAVVRASAMSVEAADAVDFVGNYTAFADLLEKVRGRQSAP
ncbi:MAG: MurT ligase domain-containing protein [Acidimicrobiales bacterium]